MITASDITLQDMLTGYRINDSGEQEPISTNRKMIFLYGRGPQIGYVDGGPDGGIYLIRHFPENEKVEIVAAVEHLIGKRAGVTMVPSPAKIEEYEEGEDDDS